MSVGALARGRDPRRIGWRARTASALATVGFLLILPGPANATTVTFGPGQTTWPVPDTVRFVSIEEAGGSGGLDGNEPTNTCSSGLGQDASNGLLPVNPGDSIPLSVGAKGGDASGATGGAGGSPDGAAGGTVATGASSAGGGGGGGSTTFGGSPEPWFAQVGGGGGCGGFASPNAPIGGDGGDMFNDGAAGSGGGGGGHSGWDSLVGGANFPSNGQTGALAAGGHGGAGYGSNAYIAGGGGGGGGFKGGSGGGAAGSSDGSGGGGGGGNGSTSGGGSSIWSLRLAPAAGNGFLTITYTPQPAPGVVTGAASNLTDVAATPGGTVNPNGLATTYHIEYGTTSGYGHQTIEGPAGNAFSVTPVSASLAGLQPGTVYHYRVVATSPSGAVNGGDQTLQTVVPPGAATGAASAVSDNAATVAGNVKAYGLPTTYHFDYGTTTAYGHQTASVGAGHGASPQPVTASLSGLTTSTVYHYRLVANRGSDVTSGPDQTFHTTGPPLAGTAGASAVTRSRSVVAGTVNPDGLPATYHFQYGTSTAYGLQTVDVAAGHGFSNERVKQALAGLRRATVYHYRIIARNQSGSIRGRDMTFITTGPTPELSFSGKPVVGPTSVRYTLQCGGTNCRVKATLKTTSRAVIGFRALTIAVGHKVSLTISLNLLGRHLRAHHKPLRAKLSIALSSGRTERVVKTVAVMFLQ